MPNQLPIINYILHIVDDTCYWVNASMEHLVVLNELLKEQEITDVEMITEELNAVYSGLQLTIGKLYELEKTALYEEHYPEFLMNLCSDTLRGLQEISGIEVQFIQLLGRIENLEMKSLYLLIVSHITLEERYSLEVLSGHINTITGAGFC